MREICKKNLHLDSIPDSILTTSFSVILACGKIHFFRECCNFPLFTSV